MTRSPLNTSAPRKATPGLKQSSSAKTRARIREDKKFLPAEGGPDHCIMTEKKVGAHATCQREDCEACQDKLPMVGPGRFRRWLIDRTMIFVLFVIPSNCQQSNARQQILSAWQRVERTYPR